MRPKSYSFDQSVRCSGCTFSRFHSWYDPDTDEESEALLCFYGENTPIAELLDKVKTILEWEQLCAPREVESGGRCPKGAVDKEYA